MKSEIQHAVTFLIDTMKNKLPTISSDKLHMLESKLTSRLEERYENHWYTDKPLKGSAYRCINVSIEDNAIDVALRSAACEVGIPETALFCVFPNGLALWVDPSDVSGQMGKGSVFPIYKKIAENKEVVPTDVVPSGKKHRPQQRPRQTCPPFIPPPNVVVVTSSITSTSPSRPSETSPQFQKPRDAPNLSYVSNQTRPYSDNVSDYNFQKLSRSQMNYARTPVSYVAPDPYYSGGEGIYNHNQYLSYYDTLGANYHPNFHQRPGQLYFQC